MPQYYYDGLDPALPATHWRKRIRSFTWSYLTIIMGTGGLAFLLFQMNTAYPAKWLRTLGSVVYVFNLVLFLLFVALYIARFSMYPAALKHSFLHPNEGSYSACITLTLANLVNGGIAYGYPSTGFWLARTANVFYWITVALSCTIAVGLSVVQFVRHPHSPATWQPQDILPAMSVTFTGATAYATSLHLPAYTSIYVVVTGYIFVGFGLFVSILYHAGFLLRLLTAGFTNVKTMPLIFINVSPIGWASFAYFTLAQTARSAFVQASSQPLLNNPNIGENIEAASFLLGLTMFGYGSWWILVSFFFLLHGLITDGKWSNCFTVGNWALTFPVAGYVAATIQFGIITNSRFVKDLGAVFLGIWVVGWLYAFTTLLVGIWRGDILAEGKDVNSPEHGYYGDFIKLNNGEEGPDVRSSSVDTGKSSRRNVKLEN